MIAIHTHRQLLLFLIVLTAAEMRSRVLTISPITVEGAIQVVAIVAFSCMCELGCVTCRSHDEEF